MGGGDWTPLRFAHGRLSLHEPIAAGGMASVHLGSFATEDGERLVAVKRAHPHLVAEAATMAMLIDEARLTLRLRHPNLVTTLDVVVEPSEVLLVMEHVPGETLDALLDAPEVRGVVVPPSVAAAIVVGAARGLHAAHELEDDGGNALGIVHRDLSPHNVIVGEDGVARVLDFGIAKALGRLQTTKLGQLKGKLRYMAPEALAGEEVDRRADVFVLGVVLWEALTGRPLVDGEGDGVIVRAIVSADFPAPSARVPGLPPGLDEVVLRALARAPEGRFDSAAEMAAALARVVTPAPAEDVARWVRATAKGALEARRTLVRRVEARLAAESSAKRRPGGLLPAAAAAVAVVGVAGLAALFFARSSARAGTAPANAAQANVAAPAEGAPFDAVPPPTASAPAADAPSREDAGASPPRRKPAASRGTRDACNPPSVIDARGIQRFKPECLTK